MSMINELVDRLRIEAKSMGTYGTDYMATLLMKSADTIEMLSEKAREPKRGKWIITEQDNGHKWTHRKCSECGKGVIEPFGVSAMKFCPNCGARMKGADDE